MTTAETYQRVYAQVSRKRPRVECRCGWHTARKTVIFSHLAKTQKHTFGDLALTIGLLRWSQRVPRATTRLAHTREPGSKGVLAGRFCVGSEIGPDRPKSGRFHSFARRERNFDRPAWDQVSACASRCGVSYPLAGDGDPIKTRRAASKNVIFGAKKWPFFRPRFATEDDLNEHAALGTIAP